MEVVTRADRGFRDSRSRFTFQAHLLQESGLEHVYFRTLFTSAARSMKMRLHSTVSPRVPVGVAPCSLLAQAMLCTTVSYLIFFFLG